jgi:hypothetical protein
MSQQKPKTKAELLAYQEEKVRAQLRVFNQREQQRRNDTPAQRLQRSRELAAVARHSQENS